ncbi:NAD(P)-binding protein [Chiua virens]|nr:NAD(P)-binding protein [Chiua virens]
MAVFSFSQYLREQWRALPHPKPVEDVTSKTFMVTGSNVGLGFEASIHLVKMRPKLLIATSRDVSKCEQTRKSILECAAESGGTMNPTVSSLPLEMGSFQSVCSLVDSISGDENRTLHVLVANAGLLSPGEYVQTQDGWEITLQVNYLSTALLSILLLPSLMNSSSSNSPSRLVLVSSFVHQIATGLEGADSWSSILETINKPEFGDRSARYYASKLLQVMFIRELASRLPKHIPIIACTVNPGYCDSKIIRYEKHQWVFTLFKRLFLVRSTEEGSRTLVHAAVGTDRSMNGCYLSSCQVAEESDFVLSPQGNAFSAKLWV